MIVIGELSLWVALLLAAWSAIVSFTGAFLERRDLVTSGERAIYMTLLMVSLASAGLWVALFTHDFSIRHVVSFSSRNLPNLFLVAAMWAGRAGGLLFCALSLATIATAVVSTRRGRSELPRVTGILAVALALVLLTLCLGMNPFARLDWIPQEGQGMPPTLQNVWASLYQPVFYAGATSLAAPLAFWMGARMSNRTDDDLFALIRKWSLVPWIITTSAVILGIRQAYTVVDQQASWLLHPVKSGSLVPCLLLIAFLGMARRLEPRRRSPPAPGISLEATRSLSTRTGSYIALFGTVLIIAGIIGREFRELARLTLTPGSSAQLLDPFGKRWSVENTGVSRYDVLNRRVTAIALDVSIDGKSAGVVPGEMRQHVDSRGAPVHEPSIVSGLLGTWPLDMVVALDDVDPGEAARIRVAFNPLVRLVWIGGILVLAGGCLIIYPRSRLHT